MSRKRWPLFTAIGAVLLVVAGFVVAPMLAAKPSYETYMVESTSVTKTVSANGQLAETKLLAYGPAEQPTLISVNGSLALPVQFGASLEIKSVKVSVGSTVKTGQSLFTYADVLGREVTVKAVASGVVRSVDTTAGLRTSGSVMTIGSNSPVVSVFVSEYDADLVALKQIATIELDAISAVFEGTVTRIGQVAQSLSGIKQYEVLLKVSDLPEGARFGMSATANIKVLTKEGVLAVPLNALVGDQETLVDVLTSDASGNQTVKRVEAKLGIFGDSFAEVISGLKVGDEVITGLKGDIPAPVNFGPPPGARNGA
jgi:multidrug efflux pump subunit AcrA (membrane-fusion protein)